MGALRAMGVLDLGERVLAWTGSDEAQVAEAKLRSLRRLVLLTLAFEGWFVLGYVPYSGTPGRYGLAAAALTLCAIAGFGDRWARPAVGLAFAIELAVVASVFPDNANHQFMALLLLALLALVGSESPERERDARAALQSMRWIAALGLAWAGVMKVVYGYWLGGEFLAYRIAIDPGFAAVFGLLLPADEIARLTSLANEPGAGPFRSDAAVLLLLSNGTWIAELALPIGLFFSRTRAAAMLCSIGLMLAIEAAAREIFFGGLMLGLLLAYAERDRLGPLLPWIGGGYGLWLMRPELAGWLAAGGGA